MISLDLDFSEVKTEKLAKYHDVSNFDCEDSDINEFLKKDALGYQENKVATTTIFIHKDEIIGFFSAAADSLKLRLSEKEESRLEHKPIHEFPAIKIARLGRDKKYGKQLVGSNILKWAIGYIVNCSEMVAVRFVTVDAYPDKVAWYEKFRFKRNDDSKYARKDHHVSMRYDLLNSIPK